MNNVGTLETKHEYGSWEKSLPKTISCGKSFPFNPGAKDI